MDYFKTLSLMIKNPNVRIILIHVVAHGWDVQQINVKNVFLNDDLQEIVYMRKSEGFIDFAQPESVCKLVKALYGLKKEPKSWYDKLHQYLITWGFTNSKYDSLPLQKQWGNSASSRIH